MELNLEKLGKVLLVLIILAAVLVFVEAAIETVAIEDVPEQLMPYWNYIVMFFNSTPVILVLVFVRNILGYARNYWKKEHKESYDINLLYATWAYYIGGLTTVFALVPAPYDKVFAGLIVLLEFVVSEIGKMRS